MRYWAAGLLGVFVGPWLPFHGVLAALFVVLIGVGLPGGRGALAVVLGALIAGSVPKGPVLTGDVRVEGRVAAAPVGRTADVEVWRCNDEPCRGRVRVSFPEVPALGAEVVVRGPGDQPRLDGLGGPQLVDGMRRSGARTRIRALAVREIGGDRVVLPPAEGARGVLAALATGDRRGVPERAWRVLRETGTAHLLAISGFHVGVVAGLFGGLTAQVLRLGAAFRPRGFHPALAWWVGAGAALLYAVMAGAPVSAQRAAGVVMLGAIGRTWGRQVDPVRLVGLVGTLVLAFDPSAVVSPGFQLSFGAVAGLLRFGPLFDGVFGRRFLGRGLTATFAATLGTLPAAAWWFQALAPSSPIANLIAVPWVTFLVAPFAAVWAYGPTWLAGPAGGVGAASVDLLVDLLEQLAWAGFTPAVSAGGAVLLGGILLQPRLGWVLGVALLVLGLRLRPTELQVTFFDVGQGDAAMVEFPDGRRWLVDGGPDRRLLNLLRRRGVRRLDRVFVSHGDRDHAGAVPDVLCGLRVERVVVGRMEGHERVIEAAERCGVPLELQAVPEHLQGANRASLVVRVRGPHGSVLFAGDVDAVREAELFGRSTVLKVPHHGSKTSSSASWLDRVRPSLAVISVGADNPYGHPHDEVLDRYASRDIPLLRSDVDGTITVRLGRQPYAYGATGPRTWFSTEPRAPNQNTATANTTSPRLMPWL